MSSKAQLERRIDAALGKIPCDTVFQNIEYLDVFSCAWKKGDVGVIDGVIVATDEGIKAKEVVAGKNRALVPGFIDAHVHLESSLMVPGNFSNVALPKGTTTAICDPHELANVMGVKGIQYFLDAAATLPLDLRVMLSSCVPATHMETNGGGILSSDDLFPLLSHPQALGLAEMMNVPGVLFKDPNVLKKIETFGNVPIDGHCPLLRGRELSAYASTGVSSCHESSQLEEAREKLTKGVAVWIREGSVAKDLKALIPLLTMATSTSIGFCTDDRNPLDIAKEGHIDHLVRGAIASGVAPEVAYRSAAWTVAVHYGLDRGPMRRGAIAPGYLADLVVLKDTKTCAIEAVWKSGKHSEELLSQTGVDTQFGNSVRASVPTESELEGPKGRVHVIGVEPGKILTSRSVQSHDARGVARLSVLERYGKGSRPANGYASGFGENFQGAIGSSVGHDSHNLIVVGSNTRDMQQALKCLIESGGGFVVVKDGKALSHLGLPLGGLMTPASPKDIETKLQDLRNASRTLGCALHEPFLQLAFLSLPVIPSLKLTDKGLVDVEKFALIDTRAA
jgi:adenine deaminase